MNDKEIIRRIESVCKCVYTMEEDFCVGLSFYDDDAVFGSTIRRHPMKSEIIKLVARLPNLRSLDLRKCKTGNLPNIASRKLEHLDLGSNDIDVVPHWVIEQKSLRYLNLGANSIRDVPDLSDLPLETLKLHKNCIGRMPPVGKDIKSLNLFLNPMQDIPAEVIDLHKIEVFTFGVNNTKTVPDLASLAALRWLTITVTQIESLPDDICSLKHLEGLQLAKNRLKRLPERIGDLVNLNTLTIYGNEIEKIPESFLDLKLNRLNVDKNPLSDCEPMKSKFSNIEFFRI